MDDEGASAHSYDSKLKAKVSPNLGDPNGPPHLCYNQLLKESLFSEKIFLNVLRIQKNTESNS